VVIAYGSNEVLERTAPWHYAERYVELVRRVRAAAGEISCAVLGVPDQAQPDWTTPPRVREIEATQRQVAADQGCAFVSALDAMGGPGSFRTWLKQDPPLASADRIHLTPKGYAELGGKVAAALLGSSI
jgi:lysophospholipase L1-like esterase